jgi:hypothetical protein
MISPIRIFTGLLLCGSALAAPQKDQREWWSLKPLSHPALPAVAAAGLRTPVDAFIAAKLAEKGLAMAPEADRRTLIRRLCFDLTGLPPAPEEVDAFVSDADPLAYEKLVDRLLASPRYGERWARHWLDVVRYGETHGYDKDQPRPNAWPYRDYVIRAFNEDKPYGRFIQEQIAGDVIFPDSVDGVTALGFIAAGPWDFIGHVEVPETKTDGRVARNLDRDDMVSNTMNSFCSITVQCARCHDHKFDPVEQKDYYRLQAVFAALDRADRAVDPDPVIAKRRSELTSTIQSLQKKTGAVRPEYGYHSGIEAKQDVAKWVQLDLGGEFPISTIIYAGCWDDFNAIGAGFGFPVRYRLEVSKDATFTTGVTAIEDRTGTDVPNPGVTPQRADAKGVTARYVRMTATKLAPRQGDFIFALAEMSVLTADGNNVASTATVTSLDSIEAPVRWARKNLVDGYSYPTPPPELAAAQAEMAKLPPARMVYAGTIHSGGGAFRGTGPDGGKPRKIAVLNRGDVNQPREEVGPGTVPVLAGETGEFDVSPNAPEGERRAALARWITNPQHPLTWRSIVNRVWHYHFGKGLSDTPNDFGRMGGLPSHPELLDWLAVEFRDGGQSFKKLHRLIVTSAVYRQASAVPNPAARAVDSGNTLLWRQNRRKLEAEAVRDSLLSVSGKLDLTMGGPSFQDFVVERPEHSPHYQYHLADPENPATHRRSVYRFLVRSQPQPFMAVLDCADPSMSVDKRNETLNPLQALALMNNKLTVAMAKHFAARLEREQQTADEQIRWGMKLALGREGTVQERKELAEIAGRFGMAAACRVMMNLNEFVFVD